MNLVKLLPGVSQGAIRDGAAVPETDTGLGNDLGGLYGTFTPNISGTRSYWNTMTLDGQMGSDADLVSLFNEVTSVDAIAEVNVVLTNYNAEYGRNSGPQINMVSKSGSSEFHGSLYWYKRHEQFNANDFFNNRDGLPKPISRSNTLAAPSAARSSFPASGMPARRRRSSSIRGKIGSARSLSPSAGEPRLRRWNVSVTFLRRLTRTAASSQFATRPQDRRFQATGFRRTGSAGMAKLCSTFYRCRMSPTGPLPAAPTTTNFRRSGINRRKPIF
jgi:hypothetical protein